jgi:hypothetical protein
VGDIDRRLKRLMKYFQRGVCPECHLAPGEIPTDVLVTVLPLEARLPSEASAWRKYCRFCGQELARSNGWITFTREASPETDLERGRQ